MGSPLESQDGVTCPFCGNANEMGNRFCIHCGNLFPGEKKKLRKRQFLFSGVTALVLVLSVGFFSAGFFGSKPIGRVNGEGITREEFSKRVDRVKRVYERIYGENIFQGDARAENLGRLKAQILDEMVTEKILLQEAKSAGYTSAPPEEIENELESIRKKNGLSDADLEKMMGWKINDLRAELGNGWIISQFVEKAVLKGEPQDEDLILEQWLAKVKAGARIETYEKFEPVSTSKASCCTSGCGGSGKAQPLDSRIEQEARTKGLEYYEKKTERKGTSARVTNYGCHIQVDIIEAGNVVLSLTYRQGEVQEI